MVRSMITLLGVTENHTLSSHIYYLDEKRNILHKLTLTNHVVIVLNLHAQLVFSPCSLTPTFRDLHIGQRLELVGIVLLIVVDDPERVHAGGRTAVPCAHVIRERHDV